MIADHETDPKARIDLIRDVVARKTARLIEIDGQPVYLDTYTASMLQTIHDALSTPYQQKLMTMHWSKMVRVGWHLYNTKPRTAP